MKPGLRMHGSRHITRLPQLWSTQGVRKCSNVLVQEALAIPIPQTSDP